MLPAVMISLSVSVGIPRRNSAFVRWGIGFFKGNPDILAFFHLLKVHSIFPNEVWAFFAVYPDHLNHVSLCWCPADSGILSFFDCHTAADGSKSALDPCCYLNLLVWGGHHAVFFFKNNIDGMVFSNIVKGDFTFLSELWLHHAPLKLFTPQGPAEGEFTDAFTAGTTYDGQEPVLKYYAVWRDNTYTVNAYVKGSGTPEDTLSQTGIYGEKIALPDMTDDQYYTDGSGQKYHFTGWINREYTTEAVTAETVYHVGDTSVGDDNILDLQAQYEKVYDVTFHRAAGENSETFRTVENIPAGQTIGGQFPTDSPAPPEGKVFIG